VFGRSEQVYNGVVLRALPNQFPSFGLVRDYTFAAYNHVAFGRCDLASHAFEQGRLARAIGTQDHETGVVRRVKGDAFHSLGRVLEQTVLRLFDVVARQCRFSVENELFVFAFRVSVDDVGRGQLN